MKRDPKVPRQVGLPHNIDRIVYDLAVKETESKMSPMLLKLVKEALKARGEAW